MDDILCDYFGLDSTRNKDVASRLEKLWTMVHNDQYNSSEFRTMKKELSQIIGFDDPEIIAIDRDILRKECEK